MGKINKLLSPSNFRKTALYVQKNGVKNAWHAALERIQEQTAESYKRREMPEEERGRQCVRGRELLEECGISFSIVVPAFETREQYLRELLTSVDRQTYPGYELVIADAGAKENVRLITEEYRKENERIRYVKLDGNRGISGNSNAALAHAKGSYVCLLDHDDTLEPDALYEMAASAKSSVTGRLPVLLYTDEDKMDSRGELYYEPHYKEDFNLDLLLSNNYICHFLAVRRDMFERVAFRTLYDGAQDYDLILQCVGKSLREGETGEAFCHIPKVLYHWRCHDRSTADNPASKMYAYEAGRKAVSDFCRDMGWKVWVRHEKHLGFYEVRYEGGLFGIRKDIGAVGGRLLRGGRICAGAYREDGTIMYQGLRADFSGYMHRAALRQDVAAVDIRFMKLRRELKQAAEEAVREASGRDGLVSFLEPGEAGGRPEYLEVCWEGGEDMELIKGCSLSVGRKIKEAGMRILWDPKTEKVMEKQKT